MLLLVTIIPSASKISINTSSSLSVSFMAHRKSFPPSYAWVEALNLIDVVFSKHQKVLVLWHEYYDFLHESTTDYTKREHKYLELLSEMASVLGCRNLSQIDIDKFYSPKAHGDQNELNYNVQIELLRVLKETQSLSVLPNKHNKSNQSDA